MNNITVNDIMDLNPCEDYTRELVQELWNGKESLSLKEILDLDIYVSDRAWALVRLVPTEIVVKWARYCADKAKEYSECAYKATVAAYRAVEAADRANKASTVAASYADDAAKAAAECAAWAAWTADYAAEAAKANKDYDITLHELLTELILMTTVI